jgi:hypothetical protein
MVDDGSGGRHGGSVLLTFTLAEGVDEFLGDRDVRVCRW